MPTSEARILANRANSLKSTGPSSIAGKEISRRNSLKHGLSGAGVVLTEDVASEVEARDAELQAEMAPKSAMGKILLRQMATFSVRMERSSKQETAAVAGRVLRAVEAFDHDRLDEADRLVEAIVDDPRGNVRRLIRTPEGVERLILAWSDLRADLTLEIHPIWTEWHRERATNLLGYRVEEAGTSRVAALSRATSGDFSGLGEADGGGLDLEGRKAWARLAIVERVDAELADLATHFETFDFEMIDRERALAPDRALFDPSKEATLARRYEGEATRGFFKAMKEFERVEAEAEVAAKAAEAEAALVRKYGAMASTRDRVPAPLPPPRPATLPAPIPGDRAPVGAPTRPDPAFRSPYDRA